MYQKPSLTRHGSFRELTLSGSPNQSWDSLNIFDFLGPDPSTS